MSLFKRKEYKSTLEDDIRDKIRFLKEQGYVVEDINKISAIKRSRELVNWVWIQSASKPNVDTSRMSIEELEVVATNMLSSSYLDLRNLTLNSVDYLTEQDKEIILAITEVISDNLHNLPRKLYFLNKESKNISTTSKKEDLESEISRHINLYLVLNEMFEEFKFENPIVKNTSNAKLFDYKKFL